MRAWLGGSLRLATLTNGRRTPHIHRAVGEGERATALLSAAAGGPILVQPVLVVAAAKLRFGDTTPAVVTLEPAQVRDWITGLPRAHSDEAVRYLAMLAEERRTWHVEAVVLNDTLRHVQRFERLEREIEDARRRRTLLGKGRAVAALAVPAGALLGYWWATAAISLGA